MAESESNDAVSLDMEKIYLGGKERFIRTGRGSVSVIVYGDQEKPSLITYPDLALNLTLQRSTPTQNSRRVPLFFPARALERNHHGVHTPIAPTKSVSLEAVSEQLRSFLVKLKVHILWLYYIR